MLILQMIQFVKNVTIHAKLVKVQILAKLVLKVNF